MPQFPRLSKNRSTPPLLRRDELLVGVAMPISTLVHQLLFVVGDCGFIESSERITGGRDSVPTYHRDFQQISGGSFHQLRSDLDVLARESSSIEAHIPFSEIDPFAYESNDRRTLNLWRNDRRVTCGVWSRELFAQFEVPENRIEAYFKAFNAIWLRILPNTRFHHIQVPASNVPTFPLLSLIP
jgi:hypothetical protein